MANNLPPVPYSAPVTDEAGFPSQPWATWFEKLRQLIQSTAGGITALTGDVTASGAGSVAAAISSTTVTGKVITGFTSGPGTVAATDTILQAINKLDGNIAGKVPTSRTINGYSLVADVILSKTDVGLGNVDNTSDATKNAAAVTLTNKTIAAASNTITGLTNTNLSGAAGITNANLATVATATFKGRTTAGTGAPEDLTVTQATALLSTMVGDSGAGGTKGLVPAPAAGDTAANKYLKANGTWATVTATPTYTPPKITNYTSGSGTHTFTGSPICVIARVWAGGGGGAGSGTAGGGTGGNGGASSFGTSLISAGGGVGGAWANTSTGGAGGTASLGSGPTGLAIVGMNGLACGYNNALGYYANGGAGGSSAMIPGAGSGGGPNTAGAAAVANSGSGGGGGGTGSTAASYSGAGGGAGGFVEAYISGATLTALAGSAAYVVGAAGTAGAAGTNGFIGGAGGSGRIEIVELYQ